MAPKDTRAMGTQGPQGAGGGTSHAAAHLASATYPVPPRLSPPKPILRSGTSKKSRSKSVSRKSTITMRFAMKFCVGWWSQIFI